MGTAFPSLHPSVLVPRGWGGEGHFSATENQGVDESPALLAGSQHIAVYLGCSMRGGGVVRGTYGPCCSVRTYHRHVTYTA